MKLLAKRALRIVGMRKPLCGVRPNIVEPEVPARAPELTRPLLVAVPPCFDQTVPNAALMVRQGLMRGWAEVCGPAKLVDARMLDRSIQEHDRPAVYISDNDFVYLDRSAVRRLRDVDTFVWVGVHPRSVRAMLRLNPLADIRCVANVRETYRWILKAEPKFVWTPFGEAGQRWLQGWVDDGLRLETVYDAADPSLYFPDPSADRFGHIRIAYVGGYWADKAQGIDRYLRPWEHILVPFGYQKWPYRLYGGQLTQDEERRLYSTVGLVPLVAGPFHWMTAESLGRHFKAAACRAFCIADQNPVIRELYRPDEMLQAESPEHFHHLVHEHLEGKIDTTVWRERAYRAVLARHLHRHRALQIRSFLES